MTSKGGWISGTASPRDSDGNLLTAIVTSLNWDYQAHITKIMNGQWSAVWAEADNGSFKTRVQCDEVEHGIAATWRAFANRHSDESSG
jgi:hypothetical protein